MDTLQDWLRSRGAQLGSWFGVECPSWYSGPKEEERALRESCGVVLAGFRTFVRATGEDRVAFLHGMLTSDVKSLRAGHGQRSAFLSQNGKLVTDLRVYAADDSLLLDVVALRRAALCDGLERFIVADDVELVTETTQVPLVLLEGPNAVEVARCCFSGKFSASAFDHSAVAWGAATLRVVHVSEVGGNGLLVCGPPELATSLFDALVAAGAVPVGMEALNIVRVDAGVPWFGTDMTEDNLFMEVGLDDAVSFTKGCYLGQEVVERIAARGHVNRKLVRLGFPAKRAPAAGTTLLVAEKEVGMVTSAVQRHYDEAVVGLGYVRREVLDNGATITTADGDPCVLLF